MDSHPTPGAPGPTLAVEHVTHRFATGASQFTAVRDVSFAVARGEFVALVGPSGCGKSTVLNFVAGVLSPQEGEVLIKGEPVRGPRTDVGYMLARDALLPWRKARSNVELYLEAREMPRSDRRRRATELLTKLGLEAFTDAYRYQLSQGMRQRVSLARTLAPDPDVLLMDEPFAALDAQTRLQTQEWFLQIWEETSKTVLFVTHDLEEAILLADRIIVLTSQPGEIGVEREVPLPRPRGALGGWLFESEFRDFHEELWHDLRRATRQAKASA